MKLTCEVSQVQHQRGGVTLTLTPARTNQVTVDPEGLRLDAPGGYISVQLNKADCEGVQVGDRYTMSLEKYIPPLVQEAAEPAEA